MANIAGRASAGEARAALAAELPLEIQPAAGNWSWMSAASSDSACHGVRHGRPYRWLQAATLTELIVVRTPAAGWPRLGLPASSHRP
jgi:hypothetical protein